MKKTARVHFFSAVCAVALLAVLSSCATTESAAKPSKAGVSPALSLWNDTAPAKKALVDYVTAVTKPGSKDFIPENDRIATFDMDGTFVGELYPTYFEYNMLVYRVFEDPAYKDRAPEDVKTTVQAIRDFVNNGTKLPAHFDMLHAYAAAKAYAGMTVPEFDAYVKAFAAKEAYGFTGMTFAQSYYKPMLEVFDYLHAHGFTCYVVSGSDRFICRALTEPIGIEPNRVIGMDVTLVSSAQGDADGVDYTMKSGESIIRTDNLIIKNLKTNKVKQIVQEIGRVPVLSFGNSGGDAAMHNYALSNPKYRSLAVMLIADDDVRDYANREKALKLGDEWRKNGYQVVSMRDDWKTIYGDNVKKVDAKKSGGL